MEITPEVFIQQRRPRFGTANPEKMQLAFWEWMIRGGESPAPLSSTLREGEVYKGYGPCHARDRFKVPPGSEGGPIWTFDRMGVTTSTLPDGRIVCVGGEHEDSYDPDFCIYNDVIVFGPDEQIEIYGYPSEVFPPTDFHTATPFGERIVIIGGLGYQKSRRPGITPVYILDLSTFQISEQKTTGENPGWIFKQTSELNSDGVIRVRGGQLVLLGGVEQVIRRNLEDFALDTESWTWRRTTNRNWSQFSIVQEPWGVFASKTRPKPSALLPRGLHHTVVGCDWKEARIVVDGVSVLISVGVPSIDIVIEGSLPKERSVQLVDEVRQNAQDAIGHSCVVEPLRYKS